MPLELQIIRASEFIRLGASEHLDLVHSKMALQELAHACRKRGVDRAVLDLRDLPILPKPWFKPAELAALVETFHEAGFTRRQKLAILYRDDPHHGVRMFAFIGSMRGWQVRAFTDFETALQWLSEEKEKRAERGEQEIPVQVASRKSVRIEPRKAID